MMKKVLLSIVFFCCLFSVSYSQPGETDSSFGISGIVRADLGKAYYSSGFGRQVFVQSDGSILIVFEEKGNTFILKKRSDGTPDLSYGNKGISNSIPVRNAHAAIQSNGKIVVMSSHSNISNSQFSLARYKANGNLDSTFSGDGVLTAKFTSYTEYNSIIIQGNEKIVVAGYTSRIDTEGKFHGDFAIARYNTDGGPDLTFSDDGKQTTDFLTDNDYASSLIIQPDGKIVAGGSALARYYSNGSLDKTFSEDGKQTLGSPIVTIALQSDGKIVGVNDSEVVRYTTDGNLDNTFDKDGKQTFDFLNKKMVRGTATTIQKDSKILITQNYYNNDSLNMYLTRYNSNGSLDKTFGVGGKQITNIITYYYSSDLPISIVAQTDGKIVVGVNSEHSETLYFGVYRYNSNGSLDKSFDEDGKLSPVSPFGYTRYRKTTIQSDGKIIAAGEIWDGSKFVPLIARYNTDGSIDHTFGKDEIKRPDNSTGSILDQTAGFSISSEAIQSDGKIVAAGTISYGDGEEGYYSDNSDFAVVRFNTDSSLDKTFGNNGIQITDITDQSDEESIGERVGYLFIQKDGKIVVIGSNRSQEHLEIAMAQYNGDGSLDKSFSQDGILTTEISGYLDEVFSAALQSDGKIVVAGRTRNDDKHSALYVALYNTDGSRYRVFEDFNSTDIYNWSAANAIAVQTDDKILIAGEYKGKAVLARLKKDGTLDSTFSNLGKQILKEEIILNDIAISNDKFYAVGYDADNRGVIARYFINDNENTNNPPTVGLAIPDNIVGYTAPARIKLNATAADKDGKITKVQFFNGTTLLHTEDVSPYGFLWTNVSEGDYTLTAKAFDNSGNITTSYDINVSVVDYNVPPVVSIISPEYGTTYTAPANVSITADAKDPNDKISKVEFYIFNTATWSDSLLGTEYYYPYTYTFTLTNVKPGYHTISAKAYDDKGLSAAAYSAIIVAAPKTLIASSKPFSTDNKTALSLKLIPNPATTILQIKATGGLSQNKPATLSIISASGVVMKTFQAINLNQQINVSLLPSGVYTLKVVSGDKTMYKQFVKL